MAIMDFSKAQMVSIDESLELGGDRLRSVSEEEKTTTENALGSSWNGTAIGPALTS